jgi:uncharacterized protein YggE
MKHLVSKRMAIWFGLVALATAACILPAASAGAEEASRLSVSAQGYAIQVPDRAWIRFEVAAEAKAPPEAIDANAEGIKRLLAQLKGKGIASQNLQTAALGLRPRYEVKHEGQREIRGELLGYVASKSIVAIVEDLSQVPSFIREFPLAGTTRIADIGFYSTKAEAVQSEALMDAIRRAQDAAQTAVTAAGRKLGQVTSLEVQVSADRNGPPHYEEPRYAYQQTPDVVAGSRLVVEPGEQQFTQNVSLQWHLQ